MEEFYQEQDQETIIQQLRLLLASKEEELHKLRGTMGSGAAGESVADQLLKELEDKKNEVNELRARMRDGEAGNRERLSRMADALDEKDKMIAALRNGPSAGSAAEVEQMESAGSGNGGGGAIATALAVADLNAAVAEKAQLQADLDQLRDEMDAILKRDLESRAGYEERIAELDKQVAALQQQRGEPRSESAEAAGEASPGARAIQIGEFLADPPDSQVMHNRIRVLERDLDEKDLSYRTVQAQLHRLRLTQHALRGLCAGLSVFLVFVLSIKTKRQYSPGLETDSLLPPASLAESAPRMKSEAQPKAEIPARTADEPERKRAVEDPVQPDLVAQAAAAATAGKTGSRIAYTVQKGDNLWLICKRMLGEGEAMSRIARENKIADPRALKVGDVIYLSRK